MTVDHFSRKILVAGATGFLGARLLALRPAARAAAAFLRPSSDRSRLPAGTQVRTGDLSDPDSLARALEGMDAFLMLPSMAKGFVPGAIEACRRAGVRRAVFVGSSAVFTRLPARTKPLREAAERAVLESRLEWTILRCSMMYGPGDRNLSRAREWLCRAPLVPLVAGGRALQQPLFVDDAAAACWTVLETPGTIARAYDLAGPRALPLSELVDLLARGVGRRPLRLPVPLWAALAGAAAGRLIPGLPRLSREQVLRLAEDRCADIAAARRDFGFSPREFSDWALGGGSGEIGIVAGMEGGS